MKDEAVYDAAPIVIARSEATKQSMGSPWAQMDCFASLAMTGFSNTELEQQL